jgi:hypothetical protein
MNYANRPAEVRITAEDGAEFAAPWIAKQIATLMRAGDREGKQRMRHLNERLLQLRYPLQGF